LHQTHHFLGLFFFFIAIIFCNIIILSPRGLQHYFTNFGFDPNNITTKEKETTIKDPINSCQTYTKKQNSFEKKKVQFNCKAYFLLFFNVPCVVVVIEHICSHCWFSFFNVS